MFVGRKGSGIYVQVRIDLDGGHVQPDGFQQSSDTAGDDTFANAADDTTTNKDIFYAFFFHLDTAENIL